MRDPVTVTRVNALHPKFIPIITPFIDEVESFTAEMWLVDQGLRTFAQQAAIYAQGRTTPGPIVTYSPPGASYHNYGLAIDMVPIINGVINWHYDYSKLRPLAQKYGLGMGLDFPHPDYDHFEDRFGLNWRDMLHLYTIKDFIPNTQFIRI
jgi:peptidoglycan L-alanyl-D-glutamate endopeptidase CwlK